MKPARDVATTQVTVEALAPADLPAVLGLLDDALAHDGVPALSDQAVLQLRHGAAGVTHLVGRADGTVRGYLQLADDDEATVGELVVAPTARRRGVGTALARAGLAAIPADRHVRAWAHGNAAAASAFAGALGFRQARVLFQMGRPAAEVALPEVRVPAGVRIRTFRPGADDEAWVRVNSRAFAYHPEQGRLGVADLRARMAEPWFDTAGFFVAERDGADGLVGFHWTKVHDRPAPAGEVYAVGVDPSEQGSGLGLALTVTGLAHLVSLGLPQLMLYADQSNVAAVRMYERLGFTVTATDVMYER